jgi:hypothetical protein
MPEKETIERARRDKRQGKAPSTQAGEFVREEIHHIREGKHGARSAKQAIAIGLAKARRAGVKLPTPKNASAATKRSAKSAARAGRKRAKPSPRRSQAMLRKLKREGRSAASSRALARQARSAAKRRPRAARKAAARKAANTRRRRQHASA